MQYSTPRTVARRTAILNNAPLPRVVQLAMLALPHHRQRNARMLIRAINRTDAVMGRVQ